MTLLTKVGKVAVPLAGAVFIEPLLNIFAPSVKPLIRQLIQSDEAKQFLKNLVEDAAVAGSGVCTNFLASQADKLLDTLRATPKLDEALIIALRKAFADMRDDLRKRNQHNTLNSFDQFFADWDEQLKLIQTDDFHRSELLEAKQFAHLFYERREVEIEETAWWIPVKDQLEAWTKYSSIPSELKEYLKNDLVRFANHALTLTLDTEEYSKAWNHFQKSVGTLVISTLRELETHILDLKQLAKVASGQFIRDKQQIEFPLRKLVDSLIRDLSTKKIYIQREVVIIGEERVKISGLKDIATRDGYFLLASPAGSGKSTLMARWLREFVSSPQTSGHEFTTKVCYHFYSKQEGTGDHSKGLTILGDQLLKAHHIQADVNSFNPATIDSIIPNSLELDHPARLLVLVDGLDEAGEPSTMTEFLGLFKRVFPRKLGRNTTVVLTVRDDEGANSLQHYQRELGLPLIALEIPEVATDSLARYVSNAADNRLKEKASQSDFLKQIIAKTEGLAIYVHYLLDELSQTNEVEWARIIGALPKGFEEYVSASLPAALNAKPHWEDALFFMALTQSPLQERDLIALTDLSGHKLKKLDFDRVSWNIKRWLRSDYDVWAFSHQKIGEVFYELYVENERQTYVDHLLAYCADWKKHESPYVLQHYADLLRVEEKDEELYDLASDTDFLNLQRSRLVNNPNALLRTLQTAMRSAAENDIPSMMAKFSLLHAKMVEEISTESWVEAFTHRGLSGALELADNLSADRKVDWYLQIANELIVSHRGEEAYNVLKKLNDSPSFQLSGHLNASSQTILPNLLQISDFGLLKSIYTKHFSESEFNSEFAHASEYFTKVGDFDKARQCARSIKNPGVRSQALGTLAVALIHAEFLDEAEQLLDEAKQLARSIENLGIRSQALGSLAVVLLLGELLEDARQLFNEAEQVAHSIEESSSRYQSLHSLARNLAHPQLLDKAQQFVDSLSGSGENARVLKTLVTALADAGHFDAAEQVASSTKGSGSYTEALYNIATALANAGHFEEAERVARSNSSTRFATLALIYLASALVKSQRFEEAEKLLDETEQVADRISSHRLASEAHILHATVLLNIQQFERAKKILDKAERLARSVEDKRTRAHTLGKVSLARAGRLNESEQVANRSEDSKSHALSLMNLALALSNTQHGEEAERLFGKTEQLARSINNFDSRFQILGTLASALAGAQHFEKAKELVGSIRNPRYQAKAVSSIATALANAGHFDEAERVARSVNVLEFQTQALGRLAAALVRANLLNKAKQLYDESKQAVRSIRDPKVRSETLGSVAAALTDDQLLEEVERARSIKTPWVRSYVLRNIASVLARAGLYDESERAANCIADVKARARALTNIASALAQAQYLDEAARLFSEAEQLVRSIGDLDSRSTTLGILASALAKTDPLNAVRIVEELEGDNLLIVLDELAKGRNVEGLKKSLVSLSYKSSSALRVCAQIIQLYDNQVDAIYSEIRPYA